MVRSHRPCCRYRGYLCCRGRRLRTISRFLRRPPMSQARFRGGSLFAQILRGGWRSRVSLSRNESRPGVHSPPPGGLMRCRRLTPNIRQFGSKSSITMCAGEPEEGRPGDAYPLAHHNGSGDFCAIGIHHVAEATDLAFERKESMALDRSALQKCVSRFPCELGRLPYGNFIGVTYAQFERVGILRTLLPKAAAALASPARERVGLPG